ncbi:MAG: DUF1987 domain-containing protein [Bacteroidetes bacterium]|nr:DUF1987 domain-containing protein [Bacteroidota bacterium]
MLNLKIEETTDTPLINFDLSSGIFKITGKSIPINSVEFYGPILIWIDDYLTSPSDKTQVLIDLEYFNTGSSKCLFEILKKLKDIQANGNLLDITWFYSKEDEGIHEAGEDFQSLIELPMRILKKEF